MSGTCPVRACGRPILDEHLMCPEHWRQVPRTFAGAVNTTWRKFRANPKDDVALKSYLNVRRQAIAYVDSLIETPSPTPSTQHRKESKRHV